MKLYTLNGLKNFRAVNSVPQVGDDWLGLGCEVIDVKLVRLDDVINSRAILGYNEKIYKAYHVLFINRGCEDERENPMEDYIIIVNETLK